MQNGRVRRKQNLPYGLYAPPPIPRAAFLRPSCHLSLEKLPETPEATVLAPSQLSGVCFCDYSHGVLAGRSVGAPPAYQLTTSKILEGASSTLGLQTLVGGALSPVEPVQAEAGHIRGIQQGRQHPVQFAGRVLLSRVGLTCVRAAEMPGRM